MGAEGIEQDSSERHREARVVHLSVLGAEFCQDPSVVTHARPSLFLTSQQLAWERWERKR